MAAIGKVTKAFYGGANQVIKCHKSLSPCREQIFCLLEFCGTTSLIEIFNTINSKQTVLNKIKQFTCEVNFVRGTLFQ